ncbi:hypothetical protein DUNSADRAFT_16459, partial [Dunaliella salina]
GTAQPAEKNKARGKKAGPHPPKLGKVALRFRLTQPHQEWAAATLIQAAWRGWASRKLHTAELKFDLLPNPQVLEELEQAQRRVFGARLEDSDGEDEGLATEPSAQKLPESQHGFRDLGSTDSRQDGSRVVQFSRRSTSRGEQLGSGSMTSDFDVKRLSSTWRKASTGIGFLGALRQQQRRSSLHRRSSAGPGTEEGVEDSMHQNSDTGSRSDSIGSHGSSQQGGSTPSCSSEGSGSSSDPQGAQTAQASRDPPSVDLPALWKMATAERKKASHAVTSSQLERRRRRTTKSGSGGVGPR